MLKEKQSTIVLKQKGETEHIIPPIIREPEPLEKPMDYLQATSPVLDAENILRRTITPSFMSNDNKKKQSPAAYKEDDFLSSMTAIEPATTKLPAKEEMPELPKGSSSPKPQEVKKEPESFLAAMSHTTSSSKREPTQKFLSQFALQANNLVVSPEDEYSPVHSIQLKVPIAVMKKPGKQETACFDSGSPKSKGSSGSPEVKQFKDSVKEVDDSSKGKSPKKSNSRIKSVQSVKYKANICKNVLKTIGSSSSGSSINCKSHNMNKRESTIKKLIPNDTRLNIKEINNEDSCESLQAETTKNTKEHGIRFGFSAFNTTKNNSIQHPNTTWGKF